MVPASEFQESNWGKDILLLGKVEWILRSIQVLPLFSSNYSYLVTNGGSPRGGGTHSNKTCTVSSCDHIFLRHTLNKDSTLLQKIPFNVLAFHSKFDTWTFLRLLPLPNFMFVAYLIWNWHLQKWGFPLGFERGTSHTPNSWSPIARHTCDAAWPAFPYP